VGARANPAVIRAPNGVVADFNEYWFAGRAYYDPVKITVPTLLVQAEWDRDLPPYMAQTLFPLLVSSPGKRYVIGPSRSLSASLRATRSNMRERRLVIFARPSPRRFAQIALAALEAFRPG